MLPYPYRRELPRLDGTIWLALPLPLRLVGCWPWHDLNAYCQYCRLSVSVATGTLTIGGFNFMPVLPKEVSRVSIFAPIAPIDAVAHFSRLLSLETDCWDVHYAIENKKADFVLLDVRAPESYSAGHVPGAVNLPHARISARNLDSYPEDTLFVVY